MVDADPRLEGGPKPLRHPVRRPDGAGVNENPFTQNPGHPRRSLTPNEILRVLDSMQLTAKYKVATPVNWKQGEDVIITPAVSNEEAEQSFPGFKTIKPYLRTTRQPG
jgi:hypothetical protein